MEKAELEGLHAQMAVLATAIAVLFEKGPAGREGLLLMKEQILSRALGSAVSDHALLAASGLLDLMTTAPPST